MHHDLPSPDSLGPVTWDMVYKRAREIAVINARYGHTPSSEDLDEARFELLHENGLDPATTLLEGAPASERWDPVPDTTGHHIADTPGEDLDAEGRSAATRLVEHGLEEAEHDQMLEAAKNHEP